MASSTSLDSFLDSLEILHKHGALNLYKYERRKREYRFLRTVLMCGRKWSRDLCSDSDNDKLVSLQSFMSRAEDAINILAQKVQSYFLKLNRVWHKSLFSIASEVHSSMKGFRKEFRDSYPSFLKWQPSSISGDELLEIIDSLLETLGDFLIIEQQDLSKLIKELQDKLRFFQTLMRFVILRGVGPRQLGDVLTHTKIVGVIAAAIFLIVSFDEYDEEKSKEMQFKIAQLIQNVNPDDPQVRKIYIKVLMASTMTKEMDKHVLEGLVYSLLVNLWELLNFSACLMSSMQNQVHVIYEGLRFLRTILKNQQEKSDELPEKVKDIIGAVVNEAENVIYLMFMHELKEGPAEELDLALFGLLENVKLVQAEVADKCPETATFRCPSTIMEEIKLVNTEVLEVADNKYSFEAQKAANTSTHLQSQGTVPTRNQVVVGFDDEAKQIISQLTGGSKKLDILSIVGMPGLGKTTLANKIYNDPSIICHFHIRAWSCISQVFRKKDLLLEILACINPRKSNYNSEMNEDDLAGVVRKHLKGNMYLLVLDDVWDIEAWNELKISFPDEANGSKILLTSRIYKLALEINPTGKPFALRQLTDDESWELLQKKLADTVGYPRALYVLGMHIAKGCKGLPLTVVITAGILATLDQDGWEELAERLSSIVLCGTKQCMNILELSYRHLPDYLKPCLLYFGAFLEDQEIPVQRLLQLWIAEGFIQKTELKSLDDKAEDYMLDLIGRSLVMVGKQNSLGGVKTCCIHDLLHEFCVMKAKEENFLLRHSYDPDFSFDEPSNTCRLSIYLRQKQFEKSRLFCPLLRSLLVSSQSQEYGIPYNLSFIFRIFKLLRVLDLGKFNLGCFPGEIELLSQLRYLAFGGTMEYIPSSIAKLSNLETFLIQHSWSHRVLLPDTIWNMKMLRHLHVIGSVFHLSYEKGNLEGSSGLCNLVTFSRLELNLGQSPEKILRKFPNIRKLKCRLSEHIGDWNKIVKMNFLGRMESLKLSCYRVKVFDYEFHFPLNLKKLTLDSFPWNMISSIGKLPNLEVLKLHFCGGETWNMEEGEFPKLKFLKLQYLFTVSWTGSDDHLPCLQKLVLDNCTALEELPSCLGYIPTLELIEVRRCSGSLVNLVQEIKEEQISLGNEDIKILIFKQTDED